MEPQQGYSASSPQQLVPPFSSTISRHSSQLPPAILHNYLPPFSTAALHNDSTAAQTRSLVLGFIGRLWVSSSSDSCVGSLSPFISPCCVYYRPVG
ncbi:uncharacterized protein LACBIDRAFT_315347 [Laccaria bicolor S238N-H82]|uniref:Predicted protein n=1 Tax=Laccaria bicolor (strain S238N-H82 / ATCC MYA-4686) TaxID=486041 RepID=B0D267_LACBS|nr:uncharacterized protein LACBIDRAFT_315347 [Laccaria bicolor S238N-H82]EDR11051.1 predicted protein [Laccaria bicolor S238N-H82]|eukprot:XP_001878352.1 predicted protein [Laccaria bicolor S238N-H82]